MATIGDKKVSLALQDGSSINLNKPKVLPASITKIADITKPGWYIGGTVLKSSSGGGGTKYQSIENDSGIATQSLTTDDMFDDSEINYVITDAPANYKSIFNLYVYPYYTSPVSDGTAYIGGYGYIFISSGHIYHGNQSNMVSSSQNIAEDLTWYKISDAYVIDALTSTSTYDALSANQGKVLKGLIDNIATVKQLTKDWCETLVTLHDSGIYVADNIDYDIKIVDADKALYVTSFALFVYTTGDITTQILFPTDMEGITSTCWALYRKTATSVTEDVSIDWNIIGLDVADSLTNGSSITALSANQGRVLNETKMNTPIYSSTDLTPGVSDLADGQIYIVYYN